ncbi:MAG: hypothetical protein CMO32_23840 [Variovorax sp.]|jgi:hypothetical protein|nr:hypothetical protein [Variovorax sp.]
MGSPLAEVSPHGARQNGAMLSTFIRIAVPFLINLVGTYLSGVYLYALASHIKWFVAIPFWLSGAGIGFGCGVLLTQGCVRALRWGGLIGAAGLVLPLAAASAGFAMVVLAPFVVVYVFIQGVAARFGAKYGLRLRHR